MFFQVEGLCVDRGITMAHLKGTVQSFCGVCLDLTRLRVFGPRTSRSRSPARSLISVVSSARAAGCRICKNSGWIELGGSGMVHPNVLRAVGVDPQEYSGFAFGFGIDRMCGLMYELDDIRLLFENDVRFLEKFE